MVSLRLSSLSGQWEPLILSISVPLTCSLSLLNVVSSTTARRHLPSPSPKEPRKGAMRDLPGGEFSITSAW